MPSLWAIDLVGGDARVVTPDRIHAVISGVFTFDGEHHAPRKSFSIRPLEPRTGGIRITIGIVDDAAVEGFLEVMAARSRTWRFGDEQFESNGIPTLLTYEDWESISGAAEPSIGLEMHFLTPTFFRRGNVGHVLPSPSVVFGHLRRRWSEVYGRAPYCDLDDRAINVSHIDVQTRTMTLRRRPRAGLVGRVRYDLSGLSEPEQAAMQAFARLAPFVGVGSSTTFGCGATDWTVPD